MSDEEMEEEQFALFKTQILTDKQELI